MSTIKSSAENLTLNADGSGNDIKFQSDAVEKGSLTDGGVWIGSTFEPTGDTAASDNAAIGYTAAEGLILTGQGSTDDVTIKNDADTTVLNVATGSSDIEVSAGDLIFGTAGKGIVLGATTNVDANTLDDYEEGTWTPDLTNGTSESTNTATYIKIGRKVFYYVYIDNLSYPSDGEHFLIDGLPFSARGSFYQGGTIGYVGDSDLASQGLMVLTLGTYIYFHRQDGTTNRALNNTMDSCANLIVSGSYEAA